MDFWKLMDILHKKQLIMNPMRDEKFSRFCEILNLTESSRVIDIGCGKGEFLHRLHALYGISGIGIDKSQYCIEDSKRQKVERAPDADLEYLQMDGKDYVTDEKFDLTSCMGASWIWGGIRGTLKTLSDMTKPSGLIVLGEPYWVKEPVKEYLEREEMERDSYHSHRENVIMGDELELTCIYTLTSDKEDWDSYEALHWWAVSEYADAHPYDPDLSEIWENMRKFRESYLRYGRDTLGWCLYVYRKPIHSII
jgi:SAM-dependent methyltransferase